MLNASFECFDWDEGNLAKCAAHGVTIPEIEKRLSDMSKRVPRFTSDEAAEKFLEQDLSDYLDPQYMQPLTFEFQPKDTQLNLRLSKGLLKAVKARAAANGISYQKFIRMVLEQVVSRQAK